MKRVMDLYINGSRADIGDDTLVLMNYTRESLDNPSVVKTSYSQSVQLPGTPANDLIFGGIYRLDQTQAYGTTFPTLAKVPFSIYDELGEVVESGYVKLESIASGTNGYHTYSVVLYGGLGGFFYNLMYNDDGEKRTLADLKYNLGGAVLPPTRSLPMTVATVQAAWQRLATPTSGDALYDLINFAPAYNGIPDIDFDADKALYREPDTSNVEKRYPNIYASAVRDQVSYGPRSDANGCILLDMESEHTEWEIQDLRAYLQRPVMSVRGFFETIMLDENSGDYQFIIDSDLLNETANPWYYKGWFTLPMFDRDSIDPTAATLSDLLTGTDSPADYLIGFAKMFGLLFVTDSAAKTITLMSRDKFYSRQASEVIDLEGRIEQDKDINPYPMDSKWYIWALETYGEFAESYEEQYGRTYGSAWIDSGYDFDSSQAEVLDGVVWKGAADVLEANPLYSIWKGDRLDVAGNYIYTYFKIAISESVSWELYQEGSTGNENGDTFNAYWDVAWSYKQFGYDNRNPTLGDDFFPKVQLHGEDSKPEEGQNVLLFFCRMQDTSIYNPLTSQEVETQPFHLSDDCEEMFLLNDNTPCWDVSPIGDNITPISQLPVFERALRPNTAGMTNSFDIGDVRKVSLPQNAYVAGLGLYDQFWKNYIADRYDEDTKVVTVKVDFRGIRVGEQLLSRFFQFGGCRWVLNKITNYSLTTYDLVECEFVKVIDMNAYTNSQAL